MNNDGDDTFLGREGTPNDFLSQRCVGLEKSHVDSIFYSTTISFNLHSHNSRVAELFDRTESLLSPRNHAKDLIDKGKDNLELVIDFCRRNHIEPFWSLRMNDVHDNWCPHQYPLFKKQHPELLLFQEGDEKLNGCSSLEPHMYATAVNYGASEVQDRQFEIIRDVCERYDVDGIELDFMRGPIFFRPTLEGKAVDLSHLVSMTNFISRIRVMTESIGKRRNKPLLVACRVAASNDANTAIGLDVESWLKQDMVDIIISSLEWWPFTGPVREMVDLGHRYGAPVYAGLGGIEPDILTTWTGAATNALSAGADGIYTFNLFSPHLPHWRILGEPETLENADKIFGVDNLNSKKIRSFENTITKDHRLPITLTPGKTSSVILPIGCDLYSASLSGKIHPPLLSIRLENLARIDKIEARLNGELLNLEIICASEGITSHIRGMLLFKAQPSISAFMKGSNVLEIKLLAQSSEGFQSPCVSEVLLNVFSSEKHKIRAAE